MQKATTILTFLLSAAFISGAMFADFANLLSETLRIPLGSGLQRQRRSNIDYQMIYFLDANKDGEVSWREFDWMRTYIVDKTWTKAEREGLRHELTTTFPMIDSIADRKLTKDEINDACFTISTILAWDYDEDVLDYTAACKYAADACHGGSVPLFNVPNTQRAMVAFKFQDENDDGRVTYEEFSNTFFLMMVYVLRDYTKWQQSQADMCYAIVPWATNDIIDAVFKAIDLQPKQPDGNITLSEFTAYIANYY